MTRNVFLMLGAVAVALMILLILGTLSYTWSYTETTFGGHLGFVLPILLGCCLFVLGYLFACAEHDHGESLVAAAYERSFDAYLNGERDVHGRRIA